MTLEPRQRQPTTPTTARAASGIRFLTVRRDYSGFQNILIVHFLRTIRSLIAAFQDGFCRLFFVRPFTFYRRFS